MLASILLKEMAKGAIRDFQAGRVQPIAYPGTPRNEAKVHARLPIYSARIDLDWRAMGVLKDGTLIWFWVGSHKTYEALLLNGRLG